MDVFSRTFLPATSEAGLSITLVSRHMPVLRRCVAPEETTLLVARGHRPALPMATGFVILLTERRLVVTRESRLLHHAQLHLATRLRDLAEVEWEAGARGATLAVTTADQVRERFSIPVRDPRRNWHVDTVLGQLFGPRAGLARAPVATAAAPGLRRRTPSGAYTVAA